MHSITSIVCNVLRSIIRDSKLLQGRDYVLTILGKPWSYEEHRNGGEVVLEQQRRNFYKSVEEEGKHWPYGGVPSWSPPLLHTEGSNDDHCHLQVHQ